MKDQGAGIAIPVADGRGPSDGDPLYGAGVSQPLSRPQWLILCSSFAFLIAMWVTHITGSEIVDDASETVMMAFNFERHGVMSVDTQAPFTPSMVREPLPVLATALLIRVGDLFAGKAERAAYFHGARAQLLKSQNVLWLLLLSLICWVAVWRFTQSFVTGWLALVLTNAPLVFREVGGYMINSLYTEALAAALITLSAVLLSLAVSRERRWLFVLAGIGFGLATMVKAAFLYVFLGLVMVLFLAKLLRSRAHPAMPLTYHALFIVSFVLIVTPWILRNQAAFGAPMISTRGGEVLYTRAVMNGMTPQEYAGLWMVYSPYPLNGAIRRLLGYSREDLQNGVYLRAIQEFEASAWAQEDLAGEKAGDPEKAITYYRKSRAHRVRLNELAMARGERFPQIAADRELQAEALEIIKSHPFQHLALTFPFLYRGALFILPPLLIAFIYGLRKRQYELAWFVLPPLGLVAFYALLSYFTPRYGLPIYPIAVCAAVIMTWVACTRPRRTTGPIGRIGR